MGLFDERLGQQLRRLGFDEERIQGEVEELGMARRLYSDADGDPVLKESYVVYLDTLGTHDRIEQLDNGKLQAEVALNRYRWFLHDPAWDPAAQCFLPFSDNVIVGAPITRDSYGEHGYELGMLLNSVRGYQLNMSARGRFVRGGVARGSLYMDDRFVTGKALVDAVNLDEKVAVFPRVVLSDGCLDAIASLREDDDWYWDSTLLVDSDGLTFVNYLTAIADDELPGEVEEGLDAHRTIIELQLDGFGEGAVREKYVWAAQYHNFVANQFFADSGDFQITSKLHGSERTSPREFSVLQ